MQFTGRITISVPIIADFSASPKAYVRQISCGIEIRIWQSRIVSFRTTFHRKTDGAWWWPRATPRQRRRGAGRAPALTWSSFGLLSCAEATRSLPAKGDAVDLLARR